MTNVELLVENVKRSKADINEVYNKGYLDGKAEGGTQKEEQEKSITITENGTTEVLPDTDKTLSKVTVEVDVPSSGGFDADAYFEQKFEAVYGTATYGGRNNFNNTFAHNYIDDVTFKPTKNMEPKTAVGMFQGCYITNLKQILEDRGVVLDTSKCTNFNIWVQDSTITHLPCISFEGIAQGGGTSQSFTGAFKLVYIEKIITRADLVWNANAFKGCISLETIEEIEGEIGTSISFSYSYKLDNATVQRIIDALEDKTGADSQVLTLHATVKAKLTEDQIAQITNKNWTLA